MTRRSGAMRCLQAAAAGGVLLALGGCDVLQHGFLNAQGPVAEHERSLFLVVCAILVFVAAPVLILAPLFAWHYRLANTGHAYRPKWVFSWIVEGFIWVPPAGIVVLLAVLLWPATKQDDPYTALAGLGPPLRVQAIGLDWKWVFIYPDAGVATVNRLAVPAGRAIEVQLTSGTVMQSLLLPQLAGQIYAMAGMSTKLNFAADRPGTYRGQNAQFNGEHFARQRFDVEALSQAGYDGWLARAKAVNRPLDAEAWHSLSARNVVAEPQTFSSVPPDLYDRIVAESGGRSHAHHSSQTEQP